MRRLAGLTVVLLLAPGTVRAQPRNVEPGTWRHFQQWRDAIEQHRPGELDEPVRAMLTLTARELESVIPHMVFTLRVALATRKADRTFDALFTRYGARGLRPQPAEAVIAAGDRMVSFGIDRFLKRAAMLHADIAIAWPEAHHARALGTSVLVDDGRRHGNEGRTWHWALGRAFLHLVTDAPRDPFVRLWYHAAGNRLQSSRNHTEARPHAERGTEMLPEDAEMQFLRGWMHDAYGSPTIQAALAEHAASLPPRERPAALEALEKDVWTEREAAMRSYRRAIALDPSHLEARLRLARLLVVMRKPGDALPHIERVVAERAHPRQAYLGLLLRGRAQFERGDLQASGAAFEAAAELLPGAQAPNLALAQLAVHAGDSAAAAAWLKKLEPESSGGDPWWDYFDTRFPAAGEWIARLREAARAGDR